MILELNSFHIFLNNYKLIFFVPKYFQKKKKFITHFQLTSPPYNVKSLETCQYSKSPIKSPRKRKHVASPGGSMGGGGEGATIARAGNKFREKTVGPGQTRRVERLIILFNFIDRQRASPNERQFPRVVRGNFSSLRRNGTCLRARQTPIED